MPNPNHDEQGRFAPAPEPAGEPSGEAAPEGPDLTWAQGLDQERVQRAMNLYDGIHNLDTREQYLGQVLGPHDPWVRREEQAGEDYGSVYQQPPEPQPVGYTAAGEPVYEQPYQEQQEYQPQQIDPEALYATFEQRFFGKLGEMAQVQEIKQAADAAVQAANLPPATVALVEQRVNEATRLYPHRQAGDLAREAAQAIATEFAQWQARPPAAPAPQGQVPGGPEPTMVTRPGSNPRTPEEAVAQAMEYSKQVLGG